MWVGKSLSGLSKPSPIWTGPGPRQNAATGGSRTDAAPRPACSAPWPARPARVRDGFGHLGQPGLRREGADLLEPHASRLSQSRSSDSKSVQSRAATGGFSANRGGFEQMVGGDLPGSGLALETSFVRGPADPARGCRLRGRICPPEDAHQIESSAQGDEVAADAFWLCFFF